MKRSWLTYLMIGGLALLLVALGLLQYRWMTQISASDGEKARMRVREQADRFAMDFNREIQNAYFNFQTGGDTWKARDWTPFNLRFEYWRKNAAHPELISGFVYLGKGYPSALRYDAASQAFVETEETTEITAMRAKIADETQFTPVDAETLTLFLPIHDAGKNFDVAIRRSAADAPDKMLSEKMRMPNKVGYLAIRLNAEVLKAGVIGDLKAKYFGDGEYLMSVNDEKGTAVYQNIGGDPDATAPLFDFSPDNFVFFANKDLVKSISGERHEAMISSHVESHTFNKVESNTNGEVKLAIRQESKPRTSVFTMTARTGGTAANPWTLAVQHSSGSLNDSIASTLRRNLAVGFGILLLLTAAVATIMISSMRARAHAQRQLDFVSSVSHEFRTPLAVIYSAGENLADGVAKETVQVSRYGDLIKGEGRKLSSMVEQILEFAGANSGKRKFNFKPTPVADIVNEAVEESRSLIDDRGFEMEASIADGLPTVSADRNALSQAIQNLIANSIKYCNGEPWLKVSVSNGDGKITIAVEDRGIGISKSDLKQIFEPFYRSKEVVDAQIHGNGLGLALVKQITEAHGGRVRATSELGKGSMFTIEIPS